MRNTCIDEKVNKIFMSVAGKRIDRMNEKLGRVYFISICERVIADLGIDEAEERFYIYLLLGTMFGIDKARIVEITKMNLKDICCSDERIEPFVEYCKIFIKGRSKGEDILELTAEIKKYVHICMNTASITLRNTKGGLVPCSSYNLDMSAYSMLYLIKFLDRYCTSMDLDIILYILYYSCEHSRYIIYECRKIITNNSARIKLPAGDKLLKMEEFKTLKKLVRRFQNNFILHGIDNLNKIS